MTIKPKFAALIKNRTFDKKDSPAQRPTIRKSSIISIEANANLNVNEEEEMERAMKLVKKRNNPTRVKYSKLSRTFILDSGNSRGWAIIREYIFNRIAVKKLKRLLIEWSYFFNLNNATISTDKSEMKHLNIHPESTMNYVGFAE